MKAERMMPVGGGKAIRWQQDENGVWWAEVGQGVRLETAYLDPLDPTRFAVWWRATLRGGLLTYEEHPNNGAAEDAMLAWLQRHLPFTPEERDQYSL